MGICTTIKNREIVSRYSLVFHTYSIHIYIHITLWLFNIAMENGPFIDGLPINRMVDLSMAMNVSHQMACTYIHLYIYIIYNYIPRYGLENRGPKGGSFSLPALQLWASLRKAGPENMIRETIFSTKVIYIASPT